MAVERTFSIIKPDATRRNLTGKINARFEEKGLRIVAQKRIWMSRTAGRGSSTACTRSGRSSTDLCTFMTSGPVVVQVLEGENAIAKNREIMGATNPANAAAGTIRKDFAESIEANSVHGSDSPENAAIEIGYFFAGSRDRRVKAATRDGALLRAAFHHERAGCARSKLQDGEGDQQGDRAADAQQQRQDVHAADQAERHARRAAARSTGS